MYPSDKPCHPNSSNRESMSVTPMVNIFIIVITASQQFCPHPTAITIIHTSTNLERSSQSTFSGISSTGRHQFFLCPPPSPLNAHHRIHVETAHYHTTPPLMCSNRLRGNAPLDAQTVTYWDSHT